MSGYRAEAGIGPADFLLSERRASKPSCTANYVIVICANSSTLDDVRSRSSSNFCGESNRQSCKQFDKYLILLWWARQVTHKSTNSTACKKVVTKKPL